MSNATEENQKLTHELKENATKTEAKTEKLAHEYNAANTTLQVFKAKAQAKDLRLEKELSAAQNETSPLKQELANATDELDAALKAKAEAENLEVEVNATYTKSTEELQASLNKTRAEQTTLGEKAQAKVDEAAKEVATAQNATKNEILKANKQMKQEKKSLMERVSGYLMDVGVKKLSELEKEDQAMDLIQDHPY